MGVNHNFVLGFFKGKSVLDWYWIGLWHADAQFFMLPQLLWQTKYKNVLYALFSCLTSSFVYLRACNLHCVRDLKYPNFYMRPRDECAWYSIRRTVLHNHKNCLELLKDSTFVKKMRWLAGYLGHTVWSRLHVVIMFISNSTNLSSFY